MSTRSFLYACSSALLIGCIAVAGAVGSSHAPAHAAGAPDPNTSCATSSPCVTDTNSGSGPGLASSSAGGTGLKGSTSFQSTSGTNFAAGILGTDASSKGFFDVGVEGKSTRGIGLLGTSSKSTGVEGITKSTSVGQDAVLGVATNGGIGVEGKSTTGLSSIGVLGQSNTVGVDGFGTTSTATSVEAGGSGGPLFVGNTNFVQVFSVDGAGNVSAGSVSGGDATFQFGDFTTTAANQVSVRTAGPGGGISAEETSGAGTSITAFSNGGDLLQGIGSGDVAVFVVDHNGNVNIAGELFTSGPCNSGCITHGPTQRRVVSYAPREAQPTLEDVGEASLETGEARVPLDPRFANAMEQDSSYLVFVTPEGDCNGLYVADRSAQRFMVKELRGGRSSIRFEYRIVAKPFGDHSARLPMAVTHAHQMPSSIGHHVRSQ